MKLVNALVKTHDRTTTSPLPTDYVHGLLLKIAAAFNAAFPEPMQAVYLEEFGDLEAATAERMYKRVIADWDKPHMMPPIKFLLERVTRTLCHAEGQWDRVLAIFHGHWHPDIGLTGNPPKLDPAAEYALRQIGGFRGFAQTKLEHEGLMRDRFIEAHTRYHEEGGEQAHFSQELSERILKQLQQAREGNLLTSGDGTKDTVVSLRSFPTPEEIQAKAKRQLDALREQ